MQITAGIRRSRSEPVGALFRRVQILHTRERLEKLDLTSSSSALRAKMKAEEEEVKEMTRPSLGLQNYAKELGHFLDRHDDAQLRRRKWQHLNWTYNVWLPLQKSVKQQVSRSRTTKEHQISRASAEDSGNRMYCRRCCVAGCKYNPSQSDRPEDKPAVSGAAGSTPRQDRGFLL